MRDSGLAQMVVDFFVSVSSAGTLPLFGFLSGGLLNLFIPSGGGQWAVQGPIMVSAAQQIGVDLPRIAMAVALGDQWTNLLQPLVIIPVMAIAGINVRDVMGYMLFALLWSGALFSVALAFF
jgi:short-chain fatty acids transporter